jgi:TolB-like protein
MKKRSLTIALILIVFGMTLSAQERIAVLDAVLVQDDIDQDVIIPITDRIAEEFVRSGRFLVIDRATVATALSEGGPTIEDLVENSESLAEFGSRLKAAYIVIPTIQRLENRFFVSPRMVKIGSDIIHAQASANRFGTDAIIFDVAEDMAVKLVAYATGTPSPPAITAPVEEPSDSKVSFVADLTNGASAFHLLGVILSPTFSSQVIDNTVSGGLDFFTGVPISTQDPTVQKALSFGVFLYVPMLKYFYGSVSFQFGSFSYKSSFQTVSNCATLLAGGGFMLPFRDFEAFLGVRAGWINNTLSYWDEFTAYDIKYWGIPVGLEGGVAWNVVGSLGLLFKGFWQVGRLTADGYYDNLYSEYGVSIGVAFAF